MKKTIACLLAAMMAVSLAGCGSDETSSSGAGSTSSQSSSSQAEKNTLKDGATLQDIVEQINTDIGIVMPAELDDEIAGDLMYLNLEEDVEEYYGMFSMSMTSADNVIAVKAKEGRADAVEEALNSRLENIQQMCSQYVDTEKANAGRVITRGDYVFLLIVGDATKDAQDEVQRAVDIVDSYFN